MSSVLRARCADNNAALRTTTATQARARMAWLLELADLDVPVAHDAARGLQRHRPARILRVVRLGGLDAIERPDHVRPLRGDDRGHPLAARIELHERFGNVDDRAGASRL